LITDEKVARINALARKARTEGLTEEEKAEQAELRREYVDAVKQSLQANLDNTIIQTPDGKRRRLEKKGEED
jgi:uncharacterized protein YnzC (UPF0291/DUF896 family)